MNQWRDEDVGRFGQETDLQRKQREHLEQVHKNLGASDGSDCMHNQCPQCHGTGVKLDGTACVHMLSCDCARCRPRF